MRFASEECVKNLTGIMPKTSRIVSKTSRVLCQKPHGHCVKNLTSEKTFANLYKLQLDTIITADYTKTKASTEVLYWNRNCTFIKVMNL